MRWGRHRRTAEAFSPSPPEEVRPRASQPRGRRDWERLELDDTPPRVPARPPDRPGPRDGRVHCGALERILYRQWDEAKGPPPETVRAVESLAALPDRLKEKLAAGLDGIYV